MKSLYRRYRPLCLEEVVGQEQVTVPLSNALKNGKINHAYLFVGPRGCGKTSVARIMAHQINNFPYKLEDEYVDIVEIDGASNRGIDNIRELREKAAIAPTRGKYKVYIIDEVHMLTKEAFNALLKTLEEPPSHVVFILATTDVYKVPVTITSRAQSFVFKLVDEDVMVKHLRTIANKEKIKIDDDALKIIARRGGGSFRDSLSLLDQISTLSDKEITSELVTSALGLPEEEMLIRLTHSYESGSLENIVKSYKNLLNSGVKPETLTEELISLIITSPNPNLIPLLSRLSEIKPPFVEAKLLVALTQDATKSPVLTPKVPQVTSIVTNTVITEPEPINLPEDNLQIQPIKLNDEERYNEFLEKIRGLNDALYSQLLKINHQIDGSTINIYPKKKITRTILVRNKTILISAAEKMKIVIHEIDEVMSEPKNDKTLSQISDIMGGEVINDGGKNPFE